MRPLLKSPCLLALLLLLLELAGAKPAPVAPPIGDLRLFLGDDHPIDGLLLPTSSSSSDPPHLRVLSFSYSKPLPTSSPAVEGDIDRVDREVPQQDVGNDVDEYEEEEDEVTRLGSADLLLEIQRQLDLLEERTGGEGDRGKSKQPKDYSKKPSLEEDVPNLLILQDSIEDYYDDYAEQEEEKEEDRLPQYTAGSLRRPENDHGHFSPTPLPQPTPSKSPQKKSRKRDDDDSSETGEALIVGRGAKRSSFPSRTTLERKVYRYSIVPVTATDANEEEDEEEDEEDEDEEEEPAAKVAPVLLWATPGLEDEGNFKYDEQQRHKRKRPSVEFAETLDLTGQDNDVHSVRKAAFSPVLEGPWANFRNALAKKAGSPSGRKTNLTPAKEESDGDKVEEEEETPVFVVGPTPTTSPQQRGKNSENDLVTRRTQQIHHKKGTEDSNHQRQKRKLIAVTRTPTKKEAYQSLSSEDVKRTVITRRRRRKSSTATSGANSGYDEQHKSAKGHRRYKIIPIVKHVAEIGQGSDRKYGYEYVTGDGVTRLEEGYLRDPDSEHPVQVQKGFVSYTGTDGKTYEMSYVADELGFRPEFSEAASAYDAPKKAYHHLP